MRQMISKCMPEITLTLGMIWLICLLLLQGEDRRQTTIKGREQAGSVFDRLTGKVWKKS